MSQVSEHITYDFGTFYYITSNIIEELVIDDYYNKKIQKHTIWMTSSNLENFQIVSTDGNRPSGLLTILEHEGLETKPIIVSISPTEINLKYSKSISKISYVNTNLYRGYQSWVYKNIDIRILENGFLNIFKKYSNLLEADYILLQSIYNKIVNNFEIKNYINLYKNEEWFLNDTISYNNLLKYNQTLNKITPWNTNSSIIKQKLSAPISIQSTLLKNNIVIGTTKIASTWITKLTKEYFQTNPNLKKLDYNKTRKLLSYELFPASFDMIPLNKVKCDTDDELKWVNNVSKVYRNILLNKSDSKIFILLRNPIDRYIQALYQDLNSYISNYNIETTQTLLYTMMAGSESFSDFKSKFQIFIDDGSTSNSFNNFLMSNLSDIDMIASIFKNTLSFLLINNESRNIEWPSNSVRIPHYNPYYSVILELCSSKYYNRNNIVLLDIDTDDISKEILNIDNKKANYTPDILKSIFYETFFDLINNNPKLLTEITSFISSDVSLYNTLTQKYK